MDQKTLDALKALAEKLGTTAEHLWAVLSRQALVSAIVEGVMFSVLTSFVFRGWKSWRRWVISSKQDWDNLDEAQLAALGGLLLGTFALGLAFIIEVNSIAAGFFNPEYSALQYVLHAMP